MESYWLARAMCTTFKDSLGMAGALCQVTKLLFQLQCPSYAQVSLAGGKEPPTEQAQLIRVRLPYGSTTVFSFSWSKESCL